jgi:DNA anti-recombination protein RmuC
MKAKRKTKAQLDQERAEREKQKAERERIKQQRDHEKAEMAARRREEAKRREWLKKQRSRPRSELPSAHAGELIYIHKRVLDGFMKQIGKRIEITSSQVIGGSGGTYVMEYTTKHGGRGTLELFDLGPMP